MLNKWVCPKCGKVVTKYSTICDNIDCTGQRGLLGWLVNWDNPILWVVLLVALFVSLSFIGGK